MQPFVFSSFLYYFNISVCVPSRSLGHKAQSILSKYTWSYPPFTYINTNLSPRTTTWTVRGGWLRRSPLTRPLPLRSTSEAPFSSTNLRMWPILRHIMKALGRRSGDRLASCRRYEWCFLCCFLCGFFCVVFYVVFCVVFSVLFSVLLFTILLCMWFSLVCYAIRVLNTWLVYNL